MEKGDFVVACIMIRARQQWKLEATNWIIPFKDLEFDDPLRIEILEASDEANRCFEEFIHEGNSDGSIRDVDPMLARNLMAGATNAAMDIKLWRRVDDLDRAAIEYFDVFYNGLLPRETT